MTDKDQPDLTVPESSVADLVDDYRQEEQALRFHARELARLRGEVLSVADLEAAEIVAKARAKIHRVIVDARHDLLELSAQVDVITGLPGESGAFEALTAERRRLGQGESLGRLVGARHDVHRVLAEARPELDRLAEQALVVSPKARVREPDAVRTYEGRGSALDRPLAVEGAPVPPVPDEGVATPDPVSDTDEVAPSSRRRQATAAVGIFALISGVILAGTLWWMRSGRVVAAPEKVAATAERSTTPPRERASDVPLPAVAPSAASRPPLSLRLMVQRATWIRTTVDGHADTGRVAPEGETREIPAEREVSLRVGDAGAVRVSLNGGPATLVGKDGEVVTRRFALDQPAQPVASAPAAPVADSTSTTVAKSQMPDRDSRPTSGSTAVATPLSVPSTSAPPPAGERPVSPPQPAGQTAADGDPALIKAASQWLDAYYRRDTAGMNAFANADTTLSDERTAAERPPAGLANLSRSLDRVNVQVAGDSAILSGRVTERTDTSASARQYVSWISQLWLREAGRWRLIDVRLVGDAKLK